MTKTTKGSYRAKVLRDWTYRPVGEPWHKDFKVSEKPLPMTEAEALAGEAAGYFQITARPSEPRSPAKSKKTES